MVLMCLSKSMFVRGSDCKNCFACNAALSLHFKVERELMTSWCISVLCILAFDISCDCCWLQNAHGDITEVNFGNNDDTDEMLYNPAFDISCLTQ